MRSLHIAAALWLTFMVAGASAADVVVIAHPSLKLTDSEALETFKGDKQFAGPTKLVPVDNSASQEEFLKKTLGIDHAKYDAIWTKKSFREGLNPPAVKSGDAAVAEFVKQNPGAVGYVGTPPPGVQVIKKY